MKDWDSDIVPSGRRKVRVSVDSVEWVLDGGAFVVPVSLGTLKSMYLKWGHDCSPGGITFGIREDYHLLQKLTCSGGPSRKRDNLVFSDVYVASFRSESVKGDGNNGTVHVLAESCTLHGYDNVLLREAKFTESYGDDAGNTQSV
jgi:hypothetical protein